MCNKPGVVFPALCVGVGLGEHDDRTTPAADNANARRGLHVTDFGDLFDRDKEHRSHGRFAVPLRGHSVRPLCSKAIARTGADSRSSERREAKEIEQGFHACQPWSVAHVQGRGLRSPRSMAFSSRRSASCLPARSVRRRIEMTFTLPAPACKAPVLPSGASPAPDRPCERPSPGSLRTCTNLADCCRLPRAYRR